MGSSYAKEGVKHVAGLPLVKALLRSIRLCQILVVGRVVFVVSPHNPRILMYLLVLGQGCNIRSTAVLVSDQHGISLLCCEAATVRVEYRDGHFCFNLGPGSALYCSIGSYKLL